MSSPRANLDVFAETLLEAALADPQIVVLTSDSRGSGRLTAFCERLPGQYFEMGIAEQNLVGAAAGLASTGKKVFAVSPACFLTARSFEQIKNDIAYANYPVRLVGISAGVSYGPLGSTHHSLHDLAALQAVPNLDIVVPADNFETRAAVLAAVDHPRPIYLRFGKKPMPDLHPQGAVFALGRATQLSQGHDVALIAAGEALLPAVDAARLLEQEGLSCGVLSLHTLRPFDQQAVLAAARGARAVLTVEEHRHFGGLGSRCAQLLMEHNVHPAFKAVGIPDEEAPTGSQAEIFTHYGLTGEGLARAARQLLALEEKP